MIPKAQATITTKIDKLNFMKIKRTFVSNDIIKKVKKTTNRMKGYI